MRAWTAVAVIVFLSIVNLRGVRESGGAFAIPTYGFMISVLAMIVVGLFRIFVLGQQLMSATADLIRRGRGPREASSWVARSLPPRPRVLLGLAALTGVEAISNGVPAFQEPEEPQRRTMLAYCSGSSWHLDAARHHRAWRTSQGPNGRRGGRASLHTARLATRSTAATTMTAQLARGLFIDWFPVASARDRVTMIILFLAANTAFNGFPC